MRDEIRAATPEFFQPIIDLCEACGLAAIDATQLEKNANRSDYILLIALRDGVFAGFIEAQIIADEIHLYDVAVTLQYRRQGIAQTLVQELFKLPSQAILLEVRESNQAARRLYQACGFLVDGMRRNYYTAPIENAVLMSRKIS